MAKNDAPLSRCPRCGVKLLHKKLSHACGDFSIGAFLEGKGEAERALFQRFVDCIAECGPYDVAPAKTRVAFLVKVRFASVNSVRAGYLNVHLVLPRELESARFHKVERVGNCWVHHLRLSAPSDFNRELRRWIRAAYSEYGERKWLAKEKR